MIKLTIETVDHLGRSTFQVLSIRNKRLLDALTPDGDQKARIIAHDIDIHKSLNKRISLASQGLRQFTTQQHERERECNTSSAVISMDTKGSNP